MSTSTSGRPATITVGTERAMRVGVLARARDPLSLAIYREHLVRELTALGVECIAVPERGPLPRPIDLLWDPGLGMRRAPALLQTVDVPIVVTVHGLLAFTLPSREIVRGIGARVRTAIACVRIRSSWRGLTERVARVIAVSRYGAREVNSVFAIPPGRIRAILHGVDHATFGPDGPRTTRERPYLLMVAQYQPKKNVDRVLTAFARLPASTRPDLLAVIPGYPADRPVPDGVEIVREARSPAQLAALYRGALGLVAPSLHETFGMPLLEAMACGCPVITADCTACPEVTLDAARHVDPRDVDAIGAAMQELAADPELRAVLRARGIRRAATHTWRASAEQHRAVFHDVLEGGSR